jgi:hypothetical protein
MAFFRLKQNESMSIFARTQHNCFRISRKRFNKHPNSLSSNLKKAKTISEYIKAGIFSSMDLKKVPFSILNSFKSLYNKKV